VVNCASIFRLPERLPSHILVFGYAALARLVVPAPIGSVVEADPDDDAVLACAVAARAEVIVSGDSDLLALESYEGIPIITAAQLMARIAAELANRAEQGTGADAQ